MNRLWIRISLVITIVVLFGMLLPITVGIAVREFSDDQPSFQEQRAEFNWDELSPEEQARIEERGGRFFPGQFILKNMAPFLIVVTVVSIIVGVLLSRGVSAPLSKLAEAARSIGAHNLSQRVEIRGSQEVAQAFNEMAADLENAEILRQSLLADVAHELRTPLSVIQGNLQAILDEVYELDKGEIARLYDQTRQLSRLVDELRILAQAEARQLPLETNPIDMSALVEDVTEMYLPIMENAGIELQTHISGGLPSIEGDRPRLTQCLQNLLNNAIHHTPQGVITLSVGMAAGNLEIQITDTGSGIAPQHLPHVFDRFYRADPARTRETGGTGLGLAITRAIIESHGGSIQAESEGAGQGSTFIVELPV